jgi:hypothetical protein
MIIKSTRVRTSVGASGLVRHLLNGDDNEKIEILSGTTADLYDAVSDAKRFNRVYALRHFIIASQISLGQAEISRAVHALAEEFKFSIGHAFVVEHKKARASAEVTDVHWHVVVAETDAATGKVLSSRFDQPRHEKIARILEIEFGHPVVNGAHNRAVLAALRNDGLTQVASQLDAVLGPGSRPRSGYSTRRHQAAKRSQIDLAIVRNNVRSAWAASGNASEFRTYLDAHGLQLEEGEKAGVVVIRHLETGAVLGAACRLVGVPRACLSKLLEGGDLNGRNSRKNKECESSNYGGNGKTQQRDRYYPSSVTYCSSPVGARGTVSGGGNSRLAATELEAVGRDRKKCPSSSSETGRAGDCHRTSPVDGPELVHIFRKSCSKLLELSAGRNAQSNLERFSHAVENLDAEMNARMADLKVSAVLQASAHFRAADKYNSEAAARHTEMLTLYRDARQRLKAYEPPRRGMLTFLSGKTEDFERKKTLERCVEIAHNDVIKAEREASRASSTLARVIRCESVTRTSEAALVEVRRKTIASVCVHTQLARDLVQLFPNIVYNGPEFVLWSAERLVRCKAKMRNPRARDIWGIPIESD